MGNSRWFFTLSGTILLVGALAIGGRGINFGIDFVSGTQIQVALERPATVAQVASAIESLHLQEREASIGIPVVQQVVEPPRPKATPRDTLPDRDQDARRTQQIGDVGQPRTGPRPARQRASASARVASTTPRSGRASGKTVEQQRGDRDHRLAAGDQRLYRAALPVEVRGAGADRADARPVDHGRRVRAHREGGDGLDGGGPADDLGLLALRHDHRLRPRPRERRRRCRTPRSRRSSTARCRRC